VNILLVDDDPNILRIVAAQLTANGHHVGTCQSPFGVAAVVMRTAPDLVVLDINMPALTGPALAALLAKLDLPKRPVLALWSSVADDVLRRAGEEAGHVATISKAQRPSEICAEIERIAANSQSF
jgi:CheY-like chemotaxis protein